jgi:geranylgeranyl diphosphate synthase type 3
MEPYFYLSGQPGKGVRERLVAAFNLWLKLDTIDLEKVQNIIQLLHNASLMIDDIEDNSKMRRGIPVCHAIYGIPSTINTANYVYFLAQQQCRLLRGDGAIDIFIDEVLRLHRGQGLDIWWRDSNQCPTEQEYLFMVVDKTGGLFRLAIRLAQSQSEVKTDFIPLVNSIGTYFQILDDYLNLRSPAYMKHKIPFEDLTEGKFSFPIIHAIRSNPLDRRLLNILKQRTEDIDIKTHAVDYMEKVGSFRYVVHVLDLLYEQCTREVAKLGGNDALSAILADLHKMSRINPKDRATPTPAESS